MAAEQKSDEDLVKTAKSIFEFSAKDIDGNTVSLDKYRGHVCLVVNVASK
jgi:glutathione peroxidase-family protein